MKSGPGAFEPRGDVRRVLLVEDEVSFCELMETVLRNAGHTVRAVPNARAAREALRDGMFDVIVTDLCTPDTNGTEMIVHLQQLRPRIPIIVISGTGAADATFRAARSLGVRQTLGKPFPLHELLAAVRNVTQGAA